MKFPPAAVFVLCALVSFEGQAGVESDNPLARAVPDTEVVRGRFRQEKHLIGLDQALVSSGSFLVAPEHGLLWRVERPIETTLVIDEQRMVQRVDGRQTLRLSRDEQPGLSVVAAVLTAIFQADLDRLRDFFVMRSESAEEGHWRVVLEPTSAGVAEVVTRLTLFGADKIERVEIDEPGGDRSVIRLDLESDPVSPLTPRERREFSG